MEILIPVGVSSHGFPMSDHLRTALARVHGPYISTISVLISGSRRGLLSLSAEIPLVGIILLRLSHYHARRPFLVVGGGAIAIIAALAFWLVTPYIAAAAGERACYPLHTTGHLADHPWIGTSTSSFEVAFPKYQSFPRVCLGDAHNDYAEVLTETEWPGGLLPARLFFHLPLGELRLRIVLLQPAVWCGRGLRRNAGSRPRRFHS